KASSMLSKRLPGVFLKRTAAGLAALAIGVAGLGALAWAMRVSPMVSELTTSGAGSTARIEVGNIGNAPLPFETVMTRMELDANGNVTEVPADENFLVFPPQGIVAVGGRQVVRVQWVGDRELPASHAYYLWVRQLPVQTTIEPNDTGGSAALQVLYTMKALIVVAPEGAQPDVKVASIHAVQLEQPRPAAEDGTPGATHGIAVTVTNEGRRYALMSGANWQVEGTDMSGNAFARLYTPEEISGAVGVGYLPPLGGRRTFTLPTEVALDPSKPINIRFTR
uniref:hypothetical protein n=1 Tax=uncultured Brevundimonas sp. TaxID=213418 RepID=UPI00260ECC8B